MSKWISINDRLPKPNKDVLIRSDNGKAAVGHICALAEDNSMIVWNGSNIGLEMDKITHWCKLPKMPKKGKS